MHHKRWKIRVESRRAEGAHKVRMASKLVIVESPAKARTIGSYLGSDYEVMASVGHIRDLVSGAKELPEAVRKEWWADYGVDVDHGFRPYYIVSPERAEQVRKLKAALKGKSELVLATDEDREGEAISWHLLQVLNPPKSMPVKRIAFHEITKSAILEAIANPRDIDESLVEAQETRRILDRLYGYTLSPVLWRTVMRNLSAGRVQSPAVKIIVDREIARRNFHAAVYWDLRAQFGTDGQAFTAELRKVDDVRVALGGDFADESGELIESRVGKVRWLSETDAAQIAAVAKNAKPYTVTWLEEKEGQERPSAPFMTTTLQQDANRKLGYGADRTMRIAQSLYEGVDLGGEQTGLITYMRTDSLTLSADALGSIRKFISEQFPTALPDKPVNYANKVKNAQEAHEAIRPTDVKRRPQNVARYLTDDQLKLYTLIWQRTVASQMKPARVLRTEVEVTVKSEPTAANPPYSSLGFLASGKQILEPNFLLIYQEGKDDDDSSESVLPRLSEGKVVDLLSLSESRHETKPPARYTDATLIKKLEEQGIGRPSTYASIIKVIEDRGYVRKSGKTLVPTFRAFLTMEVLGNNFEELVDLGFTARMDEVLDEISEGKADREAYLQEFFLGKTGLKTLVEQRKSEIPYPSFIVGLHPETGEGIIARMGKDGSPFLQLGESAKKQYANIPDDLAPADLTAEKAVELFSQKSGPSESIGFDPTTGRRLLLKNRQGFYLEVERTPEEVEAKVKPTWVSLPPGEDPYGFSPEEIIFLCSLPREVGVDPDSGNKIDYRIGKFGAYIECGTERRTVATWRDGITMTVDEAKTLLAAPRGRPVRQAAAPLKEFEHEGTAIRILSGRFGPYVTDGETNATIPRGTQPTDVTIEQALELLARRREAAPSTRGKKKAPARKATVAKATTAKTAAKKPAAKTAGKKPATKKPK